MSKKKTVEKSTDWVFGAKGIKINLHHWILECWGNLSVLSTTNKQKPHKTTKPRAHSEMEKWFEYTWRFPSSGCYGLGSAHFKMAHAGSGSPTKGITQTQPLFPKSSGSWGSASQHEQWKYLAVIWLDGFLGCIKCKFTSSCHGRGVRKRQGTHLLSSPWHSGEWDFLTDLLFELSCQPQNKRLLY